MKNEYWMILILFILCEKSMSREITNLISHNYINNTDSVKIEESNSIIFDCQNSKLGCAITFKNLNFTYNTEVEMTIKMKNNELFDDISNGFALW
jgi:hypothetical protein